MTTNFQDVSSRLSNEQLYSLAEITKFIPRSKGKKVHASSVYRWVIAGKAGVKLEAIMASGSGWYTSREALARFWAAVSEKKSQTVKGWC
jgi:hypothetical protein